MNCIEISEIQIVPVKPQNGLLAFVSFVLNRQIYIGDVALRSRLDGGCRLLYPTRKLINGKTIGLVHPISREVGLTIENAVAARYQEVMKNASACQIYQENLRPAP